MKMPTTPQSRRFSKPGTQRCQATDDSRSISPPPSSSNDSFSLLNVTGRRGQRKCGPYSQSHQTVSGKAQSARLGDVCKAEDPETAR